METSGRRAVTLFTLKVLLSSVVIAATTTLCSLFIWTLLPFVVGWSPSVVVTGSMEPAIAPGDIVVTAPIEPEALQLGYVIRFKDPTLAHHYLMHRIIALNPDGTLTTQGDANQSADSTPVPRDSVTGVARLRVPLIGLPSVWLRNGQFLQLGLLLLAVAVAARVLTGISTLVASGQANTTDGEPEPTEPLPAEAAEIPESAETATAPEDVEPEHSEPVDAEPDAIQTDAIEAVDIQAVDIQAVAIEPSDTEPVDVKRKDSRLVGAVAWWKRSD